MIIETLDKRCILEVLPEFGGLCRRLAFTTPGGEQVDVLDGPDQAVLAAGNPFYSGVWLYPFPNRLADGSYVWREKSYQLPVNEPRFRTALHGFLFRLTPQLVNLETDQDSTSATFRYEYDGEEAGYPFPGEVNIHYLLRSPNRLATTLEVTNRHTTAVPVGVGWHPYFSIGGPVDDLSLQLPSCERIALDDRLLPTGPVSAFPDFEETRPIGDLAIDASLRLTAAAGERARALLWSPRLQTGISLWQDTGLGDTHGYRYLQMFIPPGRRSIALEPVSTGINAFNTGENLVVLAPGETRRFTCGVDLVSSPEP